MQARVVRGLVSLACAAACVALAACGDDDGEGGAAQAGRSAGSGGRDADGGSDPFGNAKPGSGVVRRDGGPMPSSASDAGQACDKSLKLTLRDFTEAHPDFEDFIPDTWDGLSDYDGVVEDDLGSDKKPVYAPAGATPITSGPDGFADWYHDVDGVNQRIEHAIAFIEERPGLFVYDSDAFFPLDGRGFGNGPDPSHNFLFTTEAHTLFTYEGGEEFTFRGDDDLWVFINGKLAVDLGGVHRPLEESVDFDGQADELGIEVGRTYPMDIFHAERHTDLSNFRIETTIDLSCVQNVVVK